MRVSELVVGALSYFVSARHVFAILVDPAGTTQRFRLASCAEVVSRIDRLRDVLERPYRWTADERDRMLREFRQGWGRDLLPPVEVLRSYDVLTIVQHHFLHGLPLHLVDLDDRQPLAVTHGVTYCASLSLLTRAIDRNWARLADTDGWTFPVGPDRVSPSGPPVKSCLSYGVDVLTDKDGAYRGLAETFAGAFEERASGSTRHDIKTATEASRYSWATDSVWRRPDAICLVCHGYYDPVIVDRSCMLLASNRWMWPMRSVRIHEDVVVSVQDRPFAEIPLRLDPMPSRPSDFGILDPETLSVGELRVGCETDAQLVALFGCSTGTGTLMSNDDYLSMAYQWLKTGAASVVANLWEADFPVLTEWVRRFVVNWVELRQPKAIAVREATRGLLADHPELERQPHLWGSVALLGDWL